MGRFFADDGNDFGFADALNAAGVLKT